MSILFYNIPIPSFVGTVSFKALVIPLILLICYDFVSTYLSVTIFDNVVEGHPLINFMSLSSFFFVKVCGSVFGLCLLYTMRDYEPVTVSVCLILLIILYTIIFINNTYIIGCAIYE